VRVADTTNAPLGCCQDGALCVAHRHRYDSLKDRYYRDEVEYVRGGMPTGVTLFVWTAASRRERSVLGEQSRQPRQLLGRPVGLTRLAPTPDVSDPQCPHSHLFPSAIAVIGEPGTAPRARLG
jgi:hypothetical protein